MANQPNTVKEDFNNLYRWYRLLYQLDSKDYHQTYSIRYEILKYPKELRQKVFNSLIAREFSKL